MHPILRQMVLTFMLTLLVACATPSTGETMEGMEHGIDGAADHGDHDHDTDATTTDNMEGMEHDMDAMQAEVERLATLSGDEFEIAFLDAMIPHHQSAVEMAEIALERSTRPEMLAAAQGIINAQAGEINQMTDWLDEWHGQAPSGDDHGMAMAAEVEALRTVPADEFDVAFLDAMIPHHQSAIEMASLIAERSERAELQMLGMAIITTQQSEIEQFNTWLAEWR